MAGSKGYVLNERSANWLKTQMENGLVGSSGPEIPQQFHDGPLRRFYCRNVSGEVIPPFAIMRVNSYTVAPGGRFVANVTKPTNVIGNNTFLVNGPSEIGTNGGLGLAQDTTLQVVAYESGFTFAESDNFGVNGWKLDRIPSGKPLVNCKVYADYDASRQLCVASIRPLERILIKGSAIPGRVGLLEGGANCFVVTNETANDMLYVSDVSVKVYNWTTSTALANGDGYGAAIWIDGRWKIIAEDCNDEGSTLPPVVKTVTFSDAADAIELTNNPVTVSSVFPDAGYALGAVPIP